MVTQTEQAVVVEGLLRLRERGASFVLCNPKQTPDADGKIRFKAPYHSLYKAAEWSAVLKHLSRGGLIGHVPWRLGLTVADVDEGNATELAIAAPPLAVLASRREGGCHFYWRDDKGRTNGKWGFNGAKGDIRSANGYVILWGDAPARLADALDFPPPNAHPFPADLLGF